MQDFHEVDSLYGALSLPQVEVWCHPARWWLRELAAAVFVAVKESAVGERIGGRQESSEGLSKSFH